MTLRVDHITPSSHVVEFSVILIGPRSKGLRSTCKAAGEGIGCRVLRLGKFRRPSRLGHCRHAMSATMGRLVCGLWRVRNAKSTRQDRKSKSVAGQDSVIGTGN